jgi:hypothetical protein
LSFRPEVDFVRVVISDIPFVDSAIARFLFDTSTARLFAAKTDLTEGDL